MMPWHRLRLELILLAQSRAAAGGAELVFEDLDTYFGLDVGFAGVEELGFADDPLNLLSI
jgi:hypothetical protein